MIRMPGGSIGTGAARRLLMAVAGFTVVLSALAPGGASGAHVARSAEPTTVTIATLPLEPAALAFYARHRGFFAQQGIDAKLLVLSDPTQLVAALLSGDAQFSGLNVGGAASLKSRSAPVRVVAAGALYRPSAATSALVAAPGKTIRQARDLIGKRVAVDAQNTIAHIALLKWLKAGGVAAGQVSVVELPFAQMLAPLQRGQFDAAWLPEPFLTMALGRGATRVANAMDAVCAQECLLTMWLARKDIDANLAARFRNAMQAAAVWANQKRNDRASAEILARYTPIDKAVLAKMTRTRFAERLRPASSQPWIDVYAEFGVIPASFRAIDLVR